LFNSLLLSLNTFTKMNNFDFTERFNAMQIQNCVFQNCQNQSVTIKRPDINLLSFVSKQTFLFTEYFFFRHQMFYCNHTLTLKEVLLTLYTAQNYSNNPRPIQQPSNRAHTHTHSLSFFLSLTLSLERHTFSLSPAHSKTHTHTMLFFTLSFSLSSHFFPLSLFVSLSYSHFLSLSFRSVLFVTGFGVAKRASS